MKTAYKGMKQLWVLLLTMLLVCCMAFGAAAEGDAVQSGTNDLDGSKIEGVKVIWVTQDSATTAEGTATPQEELDDENHLYLSSVSNSEMEMVYRIEAEFSGQYDYAPGDITITIPAQVWHARKYVADETRPGETVGVVDEDRLLGYLELPVPAAPSKKADFNWQIIDGNYVLTNTRTIGATSSVSIEVGIRGIRPVDVVDMSETDPITAHVEVETNQGNTIELTSTPITAQLDTQARITSAYKDGELFEDYPGLDEKLLANLPAGTNPEDYIYVRWYTYHSHNNNQPYSLDIADVLSDAYEKVSDGNGGTIEKKVTDGIFLGSTNYEGQVLTDGEIDFTAEIGDHFTNTTTGTQYANTVYMWSAYRKDDFYVPNANESPRVYYFENEVTWTLTETDKTVEDSGNGKGKDVQKVTTKTDEVIIPYAPVKWQRPRGAFAVNKWTERIYYKDWLYGYALNLLESREEVDMDFIVETVGYGYPWTSKLTQGYNYDELNNTVVNGTLDELELDASAFGKLGWKQVTDDFQTFFNFETVPLTSEDFEFKSLRVSVPQKMRYAKKSNGTWDYVTDSKLPTPDLVIEYQLNNEELWYPAATATWGEDGLGQFAFVDVNEAAGVTTSGMTVYFPENVTDVRHTFVSNVFGGNPAEHCDIAMLDWYVYPTITMKSSDRVYGIVQELFEQSENPATKFRNDVIMDAYGWVDENGEGTLVLDNDYDYSMATYEGASYGVSLNKSGTSESDAENQRLLIHYTATLTEQSNLKERSDYDAAVEAGVIPAETSGIWYDLLPPHVVPLLDTVELRNGDTITNVYTVENYKDTGRTLLVVEAELTPVPTYSNSIGYADRPTLKFDAAYTWMDMEEYGSELVNYVAFESTVEDLRNDTLGTIKNQKGDPDTPAGGNNANTPSMPEDIIKALTDLDPNTDENRFVYGKYSHTVSSLTYAVSGLQKAVKNDLVGIWTQGLDGQEQVTVYEGHYYTYSLRVSSAENTATKGIVIYDTIENYIIPDPTEEEDKDETKAADFAHTQERVDWSGEWQGKGQWRGTLTQVDLSEFVNAGVKPVLLYSTIENLQFADSKSESTDGNFDEDTLLFSSGSYDITDREIWQVAELDEKGIWQVPEGLAVTAVAIDATTTVEGEEFVLRPEEALAGYLKMRAPDDDGSEDKWNAKGAYARKADNPEEIDWEAAMDETNNMYAYNNARVRLIQGQANEGGTNWLSNLRMIRNDYTRVGIVPEIITVEKAWQDQNDHDAMRPDSVTINVLRRLAGTAGEAEAVLDAEGQPLTAVLDESNGWKAEFKQVDIVNEDGVRYLYTFEEEPVEGYTSKVQFIDVNHYTMTNVHPNEQIEISGVKTWDDDNNALGFRPETVTLKLYRDGEHIDTRTVKANGAGEWVYTFGKLDKYAEGGKEYVYKVEEEYVPKYVGESEGYELVNNTFVPVGSLEVSKTLVGATNAAKEKAFTFTLVLLAEKVDPDAPAVPLMEKYPYTIYTLEGEDWVPGETGEIGNSGTFTLKENQKIVVENLPSEATYEIIETEAAGFTSTATGADGSIRAGQTAQAAFVNEYKASGNVQLKVGKKLTGHAIRKNQFRFELLDENGEVIRTARVEAPEADATTGGAGVGIESLTQAIFGQLEYTQADDGQTYHYTVREVDTGKPGYTTDAKVFNVAVSVADNGDGTMTVTPTYTDAAGNALTELKFENTYEAKGELTLKAWKTLEGRELKADEFTFELWSFDPDTEKTIGTEPLDTATNDADGNVVFDALKFDQNSVSLDENDPATYTYLIREKQGTDKTVAYSNQEYVITVTVFDNGDGTLSFAQGSQGYEREYVTCTRCAGTGYDYFETYTYRDYSDNGSINAGYHRTYGVGGSWRIYSFPFCETCSGKAMDSEGNWCSACHGSGVALDGVKYTEYQQVSGFSHYGDAVFEMYPWTAKNSILSAGTRQYVRVNYSALHVCDDCDGAKIVPGKLTITGEATMPVFANTLKPGALTVTKLVEGEGSSNPDQTFNFTIKLTGEVPEELDYGMTAPTPAPTATPAPEVTPKPAAVRRTPAPTTEPVVKAAATPTVKPTTQPAVKPTTQPAVGTVDTSNHYHAEPEELVGQAYAALNLNEEHEDYGKLVFFRLETGESTGPWNESIDLLPTESNTRVTATGYNYYLVDEATEKKVDRPWETDKASITSIGMRDAIKPATGYRFFGALTKVTATDLSKLDTSATKSMYAMFVGCRGLTSLDLSTFDTNKVTDMHAMFEACEGLTELDLSSFNTSEVVDMGYMFNRCYKLTSLDLSSFDTSSVTDMGCMYGDCSKLTSLDLSTFNTSNVDKMNGMFSGCRTLANLDLSTFDTSKVDYMNGMFSSCGNLTSLDLSTFDTGDVTDMRAMFKNCSNLTTLDLRMFDTSNVTNMADMFYYCNNLTSIYLSSFDTRNVTNMSSMFYHCDRLESLDVRSFDTSSVTNMSDMFFYLLNISELDLSSFDTSNVKNMKQMFGFCKVPTLDLSTFDTSKVTDMRGMFKSCTNLETLSLRTFDTSNVKDMFEMFSSCSKLKRETLDLSSFDTSSVTNMGYMFEYWRDSEGPNLSTFNTRNVKGMSYMFSNCTGLTSLDLSTFDTSSVTNMSHMFHGCNKLTELDVSTFDTSSVTTMSYMFASCYQLAELDLRTFDTSSVTNMHSMFAVCRALISPDLSSFNTSNVTNMGFMFSGCDKLTSLDLSNFDTSKVTNMGRMFQSCGKLKSLNLSSFDTSKVTDMSYMFHMTNPVTMTIGNEAVLGKNASSYPVGSTKAPYDGRWVNVADEDKILSSADLFIPGNNAGTWTWYVTHYNLNFAPGEGGAGAMPSVKVTCGEAYSFVPLFYQFGYDLIGFVDDNGVTYNVSGGLVTIPANNGYTDGQSVTLTAVWEKRDVTVSESGDSVSFALKAGETFTLSDLPASLAYEVWEELPTGWVLVEKKDDTGVIMPLETSEAVFTNEYSPEKVTVNLRASKLLDGKAPVGAFSFTLSEGGTVIQTKQNTGSGVSFDAITYDKAGEHTYTIAEVTGDDKTINYDANTYTATVKVTDDGAGNLSAEVTYDAENGEAPVFQNTTKPGALTISKQTTGTLTDKAKEQEFTFEVTFTDELLNVWKTQTVTLKGGESVTLTDIPAGLKYEVRETGDLPGWTMDGTVQEGKIASTETKELTFTNGYSLSGYASIEAEKVLLGRDLTAGEFTFQLEDKNGHVVATTTNGADGRVLFPQMEYTEEGTWEYVIVEVPGDDSTVDYSDEEIKVTVTAADEKGDGELTVTVAYDPDKTPITNTLKPGALAISKTLVSSNEAHKEKEFTFTVTLTDAAGAALNGDYTLNGTETLTVKDGTATLTIKGGETAIISGLPAGAKYSVAEAAEKGFTTVAAGETGVIMPTETAQASFTNTYAAQGQYVFRVTKNLTGRNMVEGEFQFILADGAGNELETAANAADGTVTFKTLTFTDSDVGTKTYRITESDLKAAGMTYDKTVQEIILTITDNGDGTLTVNDGLDGKAVEFQNEYNDKTSVSVEKTWQDEDDKLGVRPASVTVELYRNGEKQTEIVLNAENAWKHTFSDLAAFDADGVTYTYTVKELPVAGYDGMQSIRDGVNVFTNTVQGVLDVSKTVVAGTDSEKEFAFTVTLTKAGAALTTEIILEKAGVRETVKPDAEGKVGFTLKDGDTARLIGLPIGTEYKVEEAPEAGYTTSHENAEGLIQRYEEHKAAFTNTYEAKGSVAFSGVKTLEGRELAAGEFSFQLLDKNGTVLETVTNDADGKITFKALEYMHNKDTKVLGEHRYTVKEVIPEEADKLGGVTYTDKTYEITVKVSDKGDGTLKVEPSENYTKLDFINKYAAIGDITFEGNKTIDGRDMTEKDIFTFEVSDGTNTWTVENDNTGKIAYPTIRYTLADVGEHTYTVKETSTDGAGITVAKNTYTVTVTVTDKGDGTLKVEPSENYTKLDFVNSYEAVGNITFEGNKSIEGRKMTGKDIFIFEVSDGENTWTVENDNTGKINYPTIRYTLADVGDHTYTVREISTDGAGITVAKNTYTVTVTVTDKGDGTLKVEPSENYTELDFINKYAAIGDITFEGNKTIDGRKMTDKDIFNFSITEEVAQGETGFTGTAMNDATGKIAYPTINYTLDDLGTHTYTVKETSTDGAGITVAKSTYTVTVTVSDNGDGTLKVEPSENYTKLDFVNSYEAVGNITFEGIKTIDGRQMTDKDIFSFEVSDGENTWTVENDKEGKIAYPTISYTLADVGTHTYTVKETSTDGKGITVAKNSYTVTVTVTDKGDGTLKVEPSENYTKLDFTNTYEAKGSVTFEGTKTLTGRELAADEFSFQLLDEDGTVLEIVKNDADGKITFTALGYIHNATTSDLGDHTYTVKEVKGDLGGVTYDETEYTIKVTVTDNGDGTLKVVSSDNATELDFTNTYEAKGSVTFEGTKTLTGRELAADEFSFQLLDEDGTVLETVKSDADGKITFTALEYIHNATTSDLGEHTYTVKEVQGDLRGVTYTDKAYEITVNVSDNGDGTLSATSEDDYTALNFVNSYEAKGSVSFEGTKTLTGRELAADEFSFQLLDEDGTVLETVKSDADGKITFTALEYIHNATTSDLGEHTYTVKEVKGDLEGVTYDTKAYTVKVNVTDNGDGTLKVVASDNHKSLNFTNSYEADGTVRFQGAKQLVGREFRSGDEYLFELVENGVVVQRSRVTPVGDAEAAFAFNAIEYNTEDIGTHTYLIREAKGSIKGVTYDATQYTVTVTVADAGNGKLSISKAITVNGEAADEILFTNTYEATGELTLTAEKTVNGAEPTADQVFDFTLSDEDGEIENVQNELGEIDFTKLTYTLADLGEHTYTVKENATESDGYTIDETIYTIKAKVSDNGDGTLKVTKEITANGKAAESVTFDNKHSANLTISKTVKGCTTDETFPVTVWLYDAKGNELKGEFTYTGDVSGKLTSGQAIQLGHDQSAVIELPVGTRYKVEETKDPRFATTVNSLAMNTAEGEIIEGGNTAAFVNELITTEFMVWKEWRGGEGGKIRLTLYANGEKLDPQPEYTNNGNMYKYTELPKYDEDGDEIIYTAKEKYMDGYLTIYNNVSPYETVTDVIHNGGTIINKAVMDFKVRKVWVGLGEEKAPEITLVLYCNGEIYEHATPTPDADGWYHYRELPIFVNGERAVYSVIEETLEGFTTTYTNGGEEGDCAYNGGTITNTLIPKTGDDAPVTLWLTTMLASAAALMLLMTARRKKA